MALRKAARSTIAGTPVKSCSTTLPGLNGSSTCWSSSLPVGKVGDIFFVDDKAIDVPQARFQQHANRIWQLTDLTNPRRCQFGQAENGELTRFGCQFCLYAE